MRVAGQSNATSELMMGFNGRKLVFNHDNTAHYTVHPTRKPQSEST